MIRIKMLHVDASVRRFRPIVTYIPLLTLMSEEGYNRNYWNLMHFLLPMELDSPSFLLSSTSCLNGETWQDSEVIGGQVDDINIKRL